MIVAVGVDRQGYKHMLGLAEGATENAVVVKGLFVVSILRDSRVSSRSKRLSTLNIGCSGNPFSRNRRMR